MKELVNYNVKGFERYVSILENEYFKKIFDKDDLYYIRVWVKGE